MNNFFLVLFAIFHILLRKQVDCFLDCQVNTEGYLVLVNYLFCDYNTNERPAEGSINATDVQFGMHIVQFEVDEIGNTVDFHVWERLVWKDSRLSWDRAQIFNSDFVHVMSYNIWVPDIVMHSTTIMGVAEEMLGNVGCWISYEGDVSCVPSTVYSPVCESDHTWWPFDTMNCTIDIASWSHVSNEINLTFIEFNNTEGRLSMDMGKQNSEWEIVHYLQSERKIAYKFGMDVTTDSISFNVLLRRQSTMQGVLYMTMTLGTLTVIGTSTLDTKEVVALFYIPIPTVLMTMTLTTLWLEPNSLERMILANLNFMVHLFSMIDLQWNLPFNGSRPPELILFYENSLVLATFALILTSILRYLQELNTDAPAWISSGTVSILKSRVGQIFLVSILDPKVSARIEMNADDNTNLVSLDKRESTWRYTSILIGWLVFITILFTYLIMLFIYLPTSR